MQREIKMDKTLVVASSVVVEEELRFRDELPQTQKDEILVFLNPKGYDPCYELRRTRNGVRILQKAGGNQNLPYIRVKQRGGNYYIELANSSVPMPSPVRSFVKKIVYRSIIAKNSGSLEFRYEDDRTFITKSSDREELINLHSKFSGDMCSLGCEEGIPGSLSILTVSVDCNDMEGLLAFRWKIMSNDIPPIGINYRNDVATHTQTELALAKSSQRIEELETENKQIKEGVGYVIEILNSMTGINGMVLKSDFIKFLERIQLGKIAEKKELQQKDPLENLIAGSIDLLLRAIHLLLEFYKKRWRTKKGSAGY